MSVRHQWSHAAKASRVCGDLRVNPPDHDHPGQCSGVVYTPQGIVSVSQQALGRWEGERLVKANEWVAHFSIIQDGTEWSFSRSLSKPYTALGLARIAGQFAAEEP